MLDARGAGLSAMDRGGFGSVLIGRSDSEAEDRSRNLVVLASAMLLGMTTWFSATSVIPQLEVEWGLSPTLSPWMTISVQLGFVAGALTSAMSGLADSFPPRRLMLTGAVAASVLNVGLLIEPGPYVALALRFGTGAALAAVYPPAMKAISSWYRASRGLALGAMVGALTLGSAAPHLINALGGLDWRVVIAATSLLTVAGGVLAEYVAADGPYGFPTTDFRILEAWKAVTQREVVLSSLGYFGHMWELYAMWAWFGLFLRQSLLEAGADNHAVVAAYATFAVIAVGGVGCVLGGYLGDRIGRTKVTSYLMLISGTCALTIGLTFGKPFVLTLAIGLVWGLTVVADSAQFSAMVTEVAKQEYVGTALTLQLALGFVLTVVTIWLVPQAVDVFSWRWALALLALGPVVGIGSMLALRREPISVKIASGLR